ncbi:MAG: PIN domain-containing protein [Acidobacteria bacterium]|nr:PIN domain-containing protein [Acidobacteriota bacterium]
MRSLPAVVIDANVLVQAPVRDTLLRLAEGPELYRPLWSARVMDEVKRTLQGQFRISADRVARLESRLREHFPDAWVRGFETLADGE